MGTGAKYCSTFTLDAFLAGVYTSAGGTLKLAVLESSAVVPTIGSVSSNSTGWLADSTAILTTDLFTVGTCSSCRYIEISAISSLSVHRAGIATVVAIVESASGPRYVTTVTTQALEAGNKVNVGAWSITIHQPTA